MTKMQVKLEKTTATMLYPKLTKVNVEAEFNRDVAKSEFNKLSDDQIEDKLIDALRGLAEEINQLSSSEDLDLYIDKFRDEVTAAIESIKKIHRKDLQEIDECMNMSFD